MTDKTGDSGVRTDTPRRYVDMGDDTYAEVVRAVGGIVNPASDVLTRPADILGYAPNDLIASSTTANLIVVPTVSIMRIAAGAGVIPKLLLRSSHTTGLSGVSAAVRLWRAAPTYSAGDNAAYAVATGAAHFIAKFTGTFEQFGDGAVAELDPYVGSLAALKLAAGQLVYWDLQALSTITASQSAATFTLIPQVLQD